MARRTRKARRSAPTARTASCPSPCGTAPRTRPTGGRYVTGFDDIRMNKNSLVITIAFQPTGTTIADAGVGAQPRGARRRSTPARRRSARRPPPSPAPPPCPARRSPGAAAVPATVAGRDADDGPGHDGRRRGDGDHRHRHDDRLVRARQTCIGAPRRVRSASRQGASMVLALNRNTTNSAGFVGAIPMMQMSRPSSMSFAVIVVRSHLTKKALSGVVPTSAPRRQRPRQEVLDAGPHVRQVASTFGSNTAHWVPRSMDRSMKMTKRRTLTYFHSGSSDSVPSAPQRDAGPAGTAIAEQVDAAGDEDLLLLPGDQRGPETLVAGEAGADDAVDTSTAWRRVHATLEVVPGVHPRDMAVGRARHTSPAWRDRALAPKGARRRRTTNPSLTWRVPGFPPPASCGSCRMAKRSRNCSHWSTTASRSPVRTVAATLGFASSGAASRATSSIVARPLSPDPRLVDVGIAPMKSSSPIAAAPSWPPVAAT